MAAVETECSSLIALANAIALMTLQFRPSSRSFPGTHGGQKWLRQFLDFFFFCSGELKWLLTFVSRSGLTSLPFAAKNHLCAQRLRPLLLTHTVTPKIVEATLIMHPRTGGGGSSLLHRKSCVVVALICLIVLSKTRIIVKLLQITLRHVNQHEQIAASMPWGSCVLAKGSCVCMCIVTANICIPLLTVSPAKSL